MRYIFPIADFEKRTIIIKKTNHHNKKRTITIKKQTITIKKQTFPAVIKKITIYSKYNELNLKPIIIKYLL